MNSTLTRVNKIHEQTAKEEYVKRLRSVRSANCFTTPVLIYIKQNQELRPLTTINLDFPVIPYFMLMQEIKEKINKKCYMIDIYAESTELNRLKNRGTTPCVNGGM